MTEHDLSAGGDVMDRVRGCARAAPGVTLVDVSMIGAAGRIYLAGPTADVRRAQAEITGVLSAVTGRDQ